MKAPWRQSPPTDRITKARAETWREPAILSGCHEHPSAAAAPGPPLVAALYGFGRGILRYLAVLKARVKSGDRSPHSKFSCFLVRNEFFSNLLGFRFATP